MKLKFIPIGAKYFVLSGLFVSSFGCPSGDLQMAENLGVASIDSFTASAPSVTVGQTVTLADVLTEAGRLEISRDAAEDIIEALCRDGRLMRPGGYETLQPV